MQSATSLVRGTRAQDQGALPSDTHSQCGLLHLWFWKCVLLQHTAQTYLESVDVPAELGYLLSSVHAFYWPVCQGHTCAVLTRTAVTYSGTICNLVPSSANSETFGCGVPGSSVVRARGATAGCGRPVWGAAGPFALLSPCRKTQGAAHVKVTHHFT